MTPAQRRHAADALKLRFQQAAKVRQDQAAAAAEARQQEWLAQLVTKFSRKP